MYSSGAGTTNGLLVQAGSLAVAVDRSQPQITYPRRFTSLFAVVVTVQTTSTTDPRAIAVANVLIFTYSTITVEVGGGAPGALGTLFWFALGAA